MKAPPLEIKRNRIYRGNCLDLLGHLPPETVDLVVADPPYFQGVTHNGQKGEVSDLDISRPFFEKFYEELSRVLRPDGEVFLFTDWRAIALHLPAAAQFLQSRGAIVWNKMNGRPTRHYALHHEMILWFHLPGHQPSARRGPNIWNVPGFVHAGTRRSNGAKVHPTQKPIEIIEKILEEASAPGDLVVDPFAGSATTAVACRRTGRDYICFESQLKYYRTALRRLAGHPEGAPE